MARHYDHINRDPFYLRRKIELTLDYSIYSCAPEATPGVGISEAKALGFGPYAPSPTPRGGCMTGERLLQSPCLPRLDKGRRISQPRCVQTFGK